jgi:hypothetical protein
VPNWLSIGDKEVRQARRSHDPTIDIEKSLDYPVKSASIVSLIILFFYYCACTTQKMLRHAARSAIKRRSLVGQQQPLFRRSLATQSGDDTKKPTALAKIHLEDGTTLVGKSFGSHEGAEGEVSDL